MSISLKLLLDESVKYYPPHVDITKSTSGGTNPETKAAARQLFYDFYAMEFLHRQFGPSHMSTGHKVKAAMNNPNFGAGFAAGANWDDVEYPLSQVILNKKFVDLIEDVHEQVTRAISNKLLSYLRLGLVQELRHMMSQCPGWSRFRNELATIYNNKKTITPEDFKKAVKNNMPLMVNDIPSVMRILKFSRYYSKMSVSGGKDVFDIARSTVAIPGKPLHTDIPDVADQELAPDVEEPTSIDKMAPDEEPTTSGSLEEPTDEPYPEEPTLGTIGSKDPSYSEEDWYWDPELKKNIKQGSLEEPVDKKTKLSEDYASGRISPSTIKKIFDAINKSGLTWQDIDNVYNKIPWGGAYGGPKWGTGSSAYLKLLPKHKDMDIEEMAALVDHIFDLEHNTGGLLNKGGMNIDNTDLDRRAKATHVARYLPFVSPVVKRLILMFLKYFPGDPEMQKNIDVVLNSPTKPFTPEETAALTSLKFKAASTPNAMKADIRFFSKKKDEDGNPREVYGRYYEIKSHETGKYTIADDLRADIQVFDNFDDALKYIDRFKKDIKDVESSSSSSGANTLKSAKEMYIESHSTIKLPIELEQALYSIKMGWRSKSRCYKAYFDGSNRYRLYAFSDGYFLCAHDNSIEFKTFSSWHDAFEYSKVQTKDANDSHQAEAAAAIGGGSGTVSKPTIQATKAFVVSSLEQEAISQFIQSVYPEESVIYKTETDGMLSINRKLLSNNIMTKCFSFGKTMVGTAYHLYQYIPSNIASIKAKGYKFSSWDDLMDVVKKHVAQLLSQYDIEPSVAVPVTGGQTATTPGIYQPKGLPDYSTSNASYKVAVGIDEAPKHTIRLTKQDEDKIKAIGFEVKMFSTDVWYVHKGVTDAVKFYPNNTAKLILTSTPTTLFPVVKADVESMIGILLKNYTADMTVSPLSKSVAGQPSTQSAAKVTGATNWSGIKAGSIFEKRINDAGFTWNPTKNQYYDGNNVLVIHKDRQSDILIGSQPHHFKNLPDLINFLSDDYGGLKQGSSVPPTAPTEPVVKEIYDLMDSHKLLDVNGNIDFIKPVIDPFASYASPTTGKVVAIKLLRNYITNKLGKMAGLAESKWAIENFPVFLNYLEQVGVPDMNNGTAFIEEWGKKHGYFDTDNKLSVNEQNWITQFIDKQSSDVLPVAPIIMMDGSVVINGLHPDNGSKIVLFDVLKVNKNEYAVRYFTGSATHTSKFETFDEVKEYIENNFQFLTALSHAPVISSEKVIETQVNDLLKKYGFKDYSASDAPFRSWINSNDDTINIFRDKHVRVFPANDQKEFDLENIQILKEYLSQKYGTFIAAKKDLLVMTIEELEFVYQFSVNNGLYDEYKNGSGDVVRVYNDSSVRITFANGSPATYVDPIDAKYFLEDHYSKPSASLDDGSFSESYYDTVGPQQQGYTIRLTKEDERKMNNLGWKYNPTGVSYYNEQLGQYIVFYNKFLKSNDDKPTATLYKSNIGTKLKDFRQNEYGIASVIKYLGDSQWTDASQPSPFSNENYDDKPTDDHVVEIKLNEQDTNELKKLGFDYSNFTGFYVKTLKGPLPKLQEASHLMPKDKSEGLYELILAFNTGMATWTLSTNISEINGTISSMNGTIKQILNFVWKRWKDKKVPNKPSSPTEQGSDEIVFSNVDYTAPESKDMTMAIPLNAQDSGALKKMGYAFTAVYGYPLYKNKVGDKFSGFNDNTAYWESHNTGDFVSFPTVNDGLKYLKRLYDEDMAHLFGTSDKLSPTSSSSAPLETYGDFSSELYKLGFTWNNELLVYQYPGETVQVTPEKIIYNYIDYQNIEKQYGAELPEAIINKIRTIHNENAYYKVLRLGFFKVDPSILKNPVDNQKVIGEWSRPTTGEVLQMVNDTTIRYGTVTLSADKKITRNSQFFVIKTFFNWQEVLKFLTANPLNEAQAAIDKLIKMGFKQTYENEGGKQFLLKEPSGTNHAIVILANGIMRYNKYQEVANSNPLSILQWELPLVQGMEQLKKSNPNSPYITEHMTYKSMMKMMLE